MSKIGFQVPPWRVTSPFGMRVNPITGARRMHNGDDFGANSGTPILSVAPGVVEAKGVNLDKANGYGHWVLVRNYDGSASFYAHMREASPLAVGTRVDHSSVVGRVGSTGASTGPHLHLEIRVDGTPVAPRAYMAARPVQDAPLPSPAPGGRVHVVQRGESLSSIAKKYGVTWQSIYEANRVVIGSNPNRIFAGQALSIPGGSPAPAPAPAPRVHTVARGESLSKIAAKYGTTWQKIYADNRGVIGSNPNRIFAGQRLTIN